MASTIKTNEGYGDLRVNILPGDFTPYVFGGYGITWVSGGEASGIPNRSVNTLPFGGGIEANLGQFKVGGRFQYNYLFDKDLRGQRRRDGRQGRQRRLLGREHRPGRELSLRRTAPVG
jgi:hypothetical protein